MPVTIDLYRSESVSGEKTLIDSYTMSEGEELSNTFSYTFGLNEDNEANFAGVRRGTALRAISIPSASPSVRATGWRVMRLRRSAITTITNKLIQDYTAVTATKHWVGPVGSERPDVTFTLTGKVGNSTVYGPDEKTLSEYGVDGTVTWDELPMYDEDERTPIVYDVVEAAVTGYTSQKTKDGNAFTFTNTIVQETVEVTGEKTWDLSSSDQHSPEAPDKILVQLYRDGYAVGSPKEVVPVEGRLVLQLHPGR